jgi:flagellar biosynthesis anti-sigma factor FlgM
MKIDPKAISVERVKRTERTKSSQGEQGDVQKAKSAATDKVAISEELSQLSDIARESPIDDVELDELKQAIRSGEYKPDLESLASRLMGNPDVMGKLIHD